MGKNTQIKSLYGLTKSFPCRYYGLHTAVQVKKAWTLSNISCHLRKFENSANIHTPEMCKCSAKPRSNGKVTF